MFLFFLSRAVLISNVACAATSTVRQLVGMKMKHPLPGDRKLTVCRIARCQPNPFMGHPSPASTASNPPAEVPLPFCLLVGCPDGIAAIYVLQQTNPSAHAFYRFRSGLPPPGSRPCCASWVIMVSPSLHPFDRLCAGPGLAQYISATSVYRNGHALGL